MTYKAFIAMDDEVNGISEAIAIVCDEAHARGEIIDSTRQFHWSKTAYLALTTTEYRAKVKYGNKLAAAARRERDNGYMERF